MYFLYAKLILCILYILDENTIVTHQLQVPLKNINMFLYQIYFICKLTAHFLRTYS